jgi:pyruvate dehydrogenase E2 component (dihydrolipoamide acetyltransferase)
MAIEVIMPRLTHEMTSGKIITWLKNEGDQVKNGEPLFEVETEKAVSEVSAEGDGILQGVQFREGDDIPIGATIAFILKEGESLPSIKTSSPVEPSQAEAELPALESIIPNKKEHTPAISRIIASPLARRIAREHNVELSAISGSGPRGRIIENDVRLFIREQMTSAPGQSPVITEPDFDRIPLTRHQRITGERLAQSAQSIPHFVLEVDVDMTAASRLREQFEHAKNLKVSYSAFLVKVTSHALRLHPEINASFAGEYVKRYHEINVGLAMAAPNGLVVPIIHKADELNLEEIQETILSLQEASLDGKLSPDQLGRGTFTISNLGMYGIDRFQAIINPPQAAILAVGRIRDLPWGVEDMIELRPIATLRLSIDHRVLDGAIAAPFLREIKELIEHPYLLV